MTVAQARTAVERPLTCRYGKEAERLYYAKFPGAPSPLLTQLYIQRDDYLFQLEQQVSNI
eukprot:6074852-Pyramimonas_sp.AAC.1